MLFSRRRTFTAQEYGCRLSGADFSQAKFEHVRFESCKLDSANFRACHFDFVEFVDCELTGADFR